jgi:hypothetical protein
VVPRLLEQGIPLFAPRAQLTALKPLSTKAFSNGIVMQRYSTRVT